jgi:MFS family permease
MKCGGSNAEMSQSVAHPGVPAICAAATLSLAVAMGVGRFAFTPMLPLMLRDGSLAIGASPWLAAVNYLGYLVGALSAGRLPLTPARLVVLSLLGVVLSTVAMGLATTLPLWLALRGAAGVLSGWTLVGTSTWALFQLGQAGRPRLAGVVYSGVGLGIALAGAFCLVAAAPGVSSKTLWRDLGALALIVASVPVILLRGGSAAGARHVHHRGTSSRALRMLVLCYGLFGFGYILPATFLPALARQVVDDPRLFGLVWPVFGAAAAVSTVLAGTGWVQADRLRSWSLCHVAMAVGAVLPSLWLTPLSLVLSALLIGGTFMVITMLGMQEARARAPNDVAMALGWMTAAFALGQLAGPLALVLAPADSLDPALRFAAAGLILSALPLWRLSRHERS